MKRPRDHEGKFIPLHCPVSGCYGTLVYNDHWDRWECDGLIEPTSFVAPQDLQACTYSHQDGDHYEWWMHEETLS